MKAGGTRILWGVLIAIGCFGTSQVGWGQSAERSLRVWVDTISLNVCEGREFDSLGVWLESFVWNNQIEKTDNYVGFRPQDSVLACTMTLQWDTARIRLQPPYILTPPQTLFGRFATKVQSIDTVQGTLYVSVAANENLKIVVGKDIPLFYLKGTVRAEDTVDLPEGGARTQYLDIEGTLGDNVGTVDFQPGFVRVARDTTPEYTGTLRTSNEALDTNRRDTIFVIGNNLSNKRVSELRFSLKGDRNSFRFTDTVEAGTLASSGIWRSKRVDIYEDSLYVEFAADAAIESPDSLLIGIVIERTTDSAFSSRLDISEIGINVASCLGKLEGGAGEVTAEKIPEKEDTTTSVAAAGGGSGTEIVVLHHGPRVEVRLNGITATEGWLYDISGRVTERWNGETLERGIKIEGEGRMSEGTYFLVILDRNRRIWYKQIFIQTN